MIVLIISNDYLRSLREAVTAKLIKNHLNSETLTVICEEISGYLGWKVRSILIQDTVPRNELSFNWNKEKIGLNKIWKEVRKEWKNEIEKSP